MVRQCLAIDTGIIFDHRVLQKYREAKVLEPRPPRGKAESVMDYERRLLQLSADLDRLDIGYTPYDAMGEHWSWHILELLPSAKPTQTQAGLTMTNKPNLYKSRRAYRPKPPHPIAVHASVVDFIASSSPDHYIPRTRWRGYQKDELPWIADCLHDCKCWPREAVDAMNMDWKQIGWRAWANGQVASVTGGSKECE
ncbi:hypothetical protein FRC09_012906 [Ceratobasidium sp. 395]|nr:hypothetical protein FRC09_012906 [Ceratobasidium sp. 395]